MASFGSSSRKRLAQCDPRIQEVLNRAIGIVDFTITCGHRGRIAQERAYLAKKSQARWGQSKHNSTPSQAVDIAPWPIDWDDTEAFVYLAGIIRAVSHDLGYGNVIRWGGDWDQDERMRDERFRDYPHFEIKE
ncbi:MAG TPA: M15 family peptidase [Planctomycetes bacterium]|nr:M15 family peptidase [Planctomycetota bacterium]